MPDMKYTVIKPGSPEPMPPGGILRTTFPVGNRYRCTMTMDVNSLAAGPAGGMLNAQWEPSLPNQLSANEWRDYRAGRDAFLRRAASIAGRRVGVHCADLCARPGASALRVLGLLCALFPIRRLPGPIRRSLSLGKSILLQFAEPRPRAGPGWLRPTPADARRTQSDRPLSHVDDASHSNAGPRLLWRPRAEAALFPVIHRLFRPSAWRQIFRASVRVRGGAVGGGQGTGGESRGRFETIQAVRERQRAVSASLGDVTEMNTISEPLITEREAAGILRVSVTSLRRWRREGSGPVYRKLGRTVRYRPYDLSDFVASAGRRETGWRQRQAGASK
jgi:hypothetical protein